MIEAINEGKPLRIITANEILDTGGKSTDEIPAKDKKKCQRGLRAMALSQLLHELTLAEGEKGYIEPDERIKDILGDRLLGQLTLEFKAKLKTALENKQIEVIQGGKLEKFQTDYDKYQTLTRDNGNGGEDSAVEEKGAEDAKKAKAHKQAKVDPHFYNQDLVDRYKARVDVAKLAEESEPEPEIRGLNQLRAEYLKAIAAGKTLSLHIVGIASSIDIMRFLIGDAIACTTRYDALPRGAVNVKELPVELFTDGDRKHLKVLGGTIEVTDGEISPANWQEAYYRQDLDNMKAAINDSGSDGAKLIAAVKTVGLMTGDFSGGTEYNYGISIPASLFLLHAFASKDVTLTPVNVTSCSTGVITQANPALDPFTETMASLGGVIFSSYVTTLVGKKDDDASFAGKGIKRNDLFSSKNHDLYAAEVRRGISSGEEPFNEANVVRVICKPKSTLNDKKSRYLHSLEIKGDTKEERPKLKDGEFIITMPKIEYEFIQIEKEYKEAQLDIGAEGGDKDENTHKKKYHEVKDELKKFIDGVCKGAMHRCALDCSQQPEPDATTPYGMGVT